MTEEQKQQLLGLMRLIDNNLANDLEKYLIAASLGIITTTELDTKIEEFQEMVRQYLFPSEPAPAPVQGTPLTLAYVNQKINNTMAKIQETENGFLLLVNDEPKVRFDLETATQEEFDNYLLELI